MAKSKVVKFKNIKLGVASFPTKGPSISATFPRGERDANEMVELLVNARLNVNLDLQSEDEDGKLLKGDFIKVNAIADVHSLKFNADETCAMKMSFKDGEVEVTDFAKLSNKTGNLAVARVGDAAAAPKTNSKDDGEVDPEE